MFREKLKNLMVVAIDAAVAGLFTVLAEEVIAFLHAVDDDDDREVGDDLDPEDNA
jgi:hypothetical protein